ncbi:MAG: hypothetical protein ACR2ID_01775 [Chthoniobacterales bacterium]
MATLPLIGARPAAGVLALLWLGALLVLAQEPAARSVRISFLPPPLEGTISLGIYDSNGRLVRVLQRESGFEEFQVGSDALSTTWDGKGDDEHPLPAGKYHARGYVVGDLTVEGVGFYFNDWVSEDRPERITRLCAIAAENDQLMVAAKLADGSSALLGCDPAGKVITFRNDPPREDCGEDVSADPIAAASGKDRTRWTIERLPDDTERVQVRQYAPDHELLRSLTVPAGEPQPRRIAASHENDQIFLLEEGSSGQRLRSLSLLSTSGGGEHSISDWRVDFEKKITAHKDFRIENGKAVVEAGDPPRETVSVKLVTNPLLKDGPAKLELTVGSDEEGSYLRTAAGLPLQSISDTPGLARVVLALHGEKAVDVFQDDGVVVEQFRISGLDQMMAFDCGEIELK